MDTHIVGCDTETRGELASGDCTFTDGTRYDAYTFSGTKGQVVEFTFRPLATSLTLPYIALLSPLDDASHPPAVYDGKGAAQIEYQLSSTGTWTVLVSSDSLFASGAYVLHTYCYADSTPSGPQSCVFQNLLCGQTLEGRLTADSCSFRSVPRAYAGVWVYGVQGDVLTITEDSTAFRPLFGIYQGSALLASSSSSATQARMVYSVPATGWYNIDATTTEDNRGGFFTLRLECVGSGCVFPYLASDVPNQIAPYGQPAIIPMDLFTVGETTTNLFDHQSGKRTSTISTSKTRVANGSVRISSSRLIACRGDDRSESRSLPPYRSTL